MSTTSAARANPSLAPFRLNPAQHSIVHLGLGAFHRAHQAVYLQALHDLGDTQWQLIGGNLRPDPSGTLAQLAQQQGRYTLETVDPQGQRRYQEIHALAHVVPFVAGPQLLAQSALAQLAADSQCKIISFTVTEAGYYFDPQHALDTAHPEIVADIAALRQGVMGSTIYGALCGILQLRRHHNAGPVTLLNCDNLRHNGQRLAEGLAQFIALLGDHALAQWCQQHISTPNAMVDRITPRPQPEVAARVKAATQYQTDAAVMAEDFIQWVIEDKFCAPRPAWEKVGVELVADVAPYEEAKIRILNASHSGIAWAGTLAGYQYIHQGTRDPQIYAWTHDYVTQGVLPCLAGSPLDLAAYRDRVLARFTNAALEDNNQRVAMDGFSKIPGFIAPTLRELLTAGRDLQAVALLPALFLHFLQRLHAGRVPYTYHDQAFNPQILPTLVGPLPQVMRVFCSLPELWGDLVQQPQLMAAITQAYQRINACQLGRD